MNTILKYNKHIIIYFFILAILFIITGCQPQKGQPVGLYSNVVAVGDSLTFGYGGNGINYPTELGALIGHAVINEGKNGDTTQDVLNRIESIIENHQPSVVILAIGGNDMLRNIPDETIISNLNKIITKVKQNAAQVILIAIPRPRATGVVFNLHDASFYKDIAKDNDIMFVENTFSNILSDKRYLSDPIHLNGDGYKKVSELMANQINNFNVFKK